MPRLTSRVFTDLAIWMTGFGLLIGVAFPPFCLLLGLPAPRVIAPGFFGATIAAGLVVGAVNYGLARLVVGARLRQLAERMGAVESQLAAAVFSHDWSDCDPESCALPVDSDDEVGASAAAFDRLIGTLGRSHTIESAMRDFGAVLSSAFELDQLAERSLEGLLRHTGADAGALLVVREGHLETVASHGLRDVHVLGASDHVRRALRTDHVARLSVAQAPGAVVDSLLVGQSAAEVVVVPISFKSVPLGVAILASVGAFADDGVGLLEHFRADLGLAVNNALAHDRLERLAAIDPLTDAYNRRFGLGRLREEYSRAVRAEAPLGLLMVDLDQFKVVNDTYGHLVGDRLLRAISAACRRVIREGDVLVRCGGDEFLVILPGAGMEDVRGIGGRIRRAVAETTVEDGPIRIGVTVSLGGVTYRDTANSPDALLEAADAALYEAKEGGRDRLVLA